MLQSQQLKQFCSDIQDLQQQVSESTRSAQCQSDNSFVDTRMEQLNADIMELTDLCASKHALLESSLQAQLLSLKPELDQQCSAQRRLTSPVMVKETEVDAIVVNQVHAMLFYTMEPAFTPLAEHLAAKIIELEGPLPQGDVT